jgi:hypothetical protein
MAAEQVVADEVEDKPEPTLREQLESSLEEVQARQESEHGGHESVSETERSESAAVQEPDAGRARGPDGKFARAQPPAETPQPSQSAGNAAPQQPVQPVALPAPTSWKAEEKALWAKVPAEVQQVLHRREQDVHRALTTQDEVRSLGNQFMATANEYAPIINARGITPVALFRENLGIIAQLNNPDPAVRANMVRQIAASSGVDIRSLMGQPPNAQNPQGQPNIPIDQLVQRQVNEAFQARQQQEAQARERAEMQATNSEIESFRSKVDANGQPAYPYFDHVTSLMASILGGGVASTLEEAYQLAVKAHPETSQLIAQAETAAARAKEDAKRKAEAKRRAGGSIRSSPGTPVMANGKDRSIRDELKSAFEEARGRI